jgi:iron complex outermembrane receptor protein/hemoglobin/transferrin/lactoferrin receptor protein
MATSMLLASTLVLLAAQDTTRVDTTVQLRELVVTATRQREAARLEQAPALSVSRPTPAVRGNAQVAADLVRDLAGAQIQQTSAGQGAIILRGLTGNQVLLLVDGIPLNNGTYRDGPGQYLATIDPGTVEQIEVIRGPASVLYGSDAQGGVLNLITGPHTDGDGSSVGAALHGTTASGSYRARASGRWSTPGVSVSAGASLARASDLEPGGELGAQLPTSFRTAGGDVRLDVRAGERQDVTVVAQHFEMRDVHRFDRYVTFRAPEPGRDVEHRFDPQTRQLAYLRYSVHGGSMGLANFEATASLNVQREGRFERRRLDTGVPDSLQQQLRDEVLTPGLALVGSSIATLADRLVSLTWGAEIYRDQLASEGFIEHLPTGVRTPITRTTSGGSDIPSGRFPDGSTARRLGVFLAGESDLAPWLSVSMGGRWSQFRSEAEVGTDFGGRVANSSADFTGQLGLVTRPGEDWRLAARVAEGFRAPNLYDLTNVGSVPGGIQVPNPDAQPERSVSGELSVRYATTGVAASITAYRNWIRDFLDRAPGEFLGDTLFRGERVFQGVNIGRATVTGAEAELAFRHGRLDGGATLLYARGEQRLADGELQPMSKIPPLAGSARVRWSSLSSPWVEAGLRWAAAQRRLGERDLRDPRIASGGTPGFFVLGVRAGVQMASDLGVAAGAENLGNRLYREHASGVDAPGRHVWLEVTWRTGL